MKKISILILLLSLLAISCCKQGESEYETMHLTGTKISTDSSYLRSYPKLLIADTLISTTSKRDANYCVSVFRNDSLITLGTVFPIGNGYGEYNSVRIGMDSNERLSIIDVIGNSSILKRIERDYITGFLKNNPEAILDANDIPEMPSLRYATDNFVNIDESTILINGSTYDKSDHIFSIVNLKNGNVEPLDFWPKDGYEGTSLPKQSVYTDNALILKGKNKFLYKCGEERYAFIFSIEGNQIKVEKELYGELPDYEQSPDGMNYNLKSRSIRQMECDVRDENIYVLLVDKNSKGEKAANWRESDSGNEIMVYDWDGTVKAKFVLDNVGTDIKVTDDNKTLYLFSDNPNNGEKDVYVYSIDAH